MPGNSSILRRWLRIALNVILQPRLWRLFKERSFSAMTEEAFMRLLGFQGSREEVLHHFHTGARLRFFFHPRNQKDFFLHLLTQTQPFEQILEEADDVVSNKFQALGSPLVSLGPAINWQRDFKSGKEWPPRSLSTDEMLDLDSSSDIKVPWELSRFHQVWWLGKAYWLTHNEEYARKFRELADDWISNNPVGEGVNWAIGMEVAIRACNWIAGYYFFCDSPSCGPEFWIRFLKSLYMHGRFIEYHMEYGRRTGNHLLADIVGLLFLGIFFQGTAFGRGWREANVRRLEEEMHNQVYADGVDYEKSIAYHRLVLELFSVATVLCRLNKIALSGSFLQRLERMFEFVHSYTRPDGSVPLVGDADNGHLFRFCREEDVNDHRPMLSVGSILFKRADFKNSAGRFAQDSLWLFGGEGFEHHQSLGTTASSPVSQAFSRGGFYVMRSNDVHVFIDAGNIGMEGWGGHGHNDTFSFELWAHGSPLIVDSGTFAYTSDSPSRQEFRSTRAHNTIMVDGAELAEFSGLWRIKEDRTNPKVLEWITTDERDVLEAEHYAYQRLASPVIHRRRFEFLKKSSELLLSDHIMGPGHHRIESFLHFLPDVQVKLQGKGEAEVSGVSGTYRILFTGAAGGVAESRFSKSYGLVQSNKSLVLTTEGTSPFEINFRIVNESLAAS